MGRGSVDGATDDIGVIMMVLNAVAWQYWRWCDNMVMITVHCEYNNSGDDQNDGDGTRCGNGWGILV
jgi:hypothetical protein